MFYDEIDRAMEESEKQDKRDNRTEKFSFVVLGLVAAAWLVVLLVSGQGEFRAQYDRCIAAGGDTVSCSVEQGGP